MKTAEQVRDACSPDHDWGTAKVCVPCLRNALADAEAELAQAWEAGRDCGRCGECSGRSGLAAQAAREVMR